MSVYEIYEKMPTSLKNNLGLPLTCHKEHMLIMRAVGE